MFLWPSEPKSEVCYCPKCKRLGLHPYIDDDHLSCAYCSDMFNVPADVQAANEQVDMPVYIDT